VRYRAQGTDTVPAMLTPGEIVINAAQQQRVAAAITSARQDSGGYLPVTINVDGVAIAETFVRAVKRMRLV
jgi:hypothetical protein